MLRSAELILAACFCFAVGCASNESSNSANVSGDDNTLSQQNTSGAEASPDVEANPSTAVGPGASSSSAPVQPGPDATEPPSP